MEYLVSSTVYNVIQYIYVVETLVVLCYLDKHFVIATRQCFLIMQKKQIESNQTMFRHQPCSIIKQTASGLPSPGGSLFVWARRKRYSDRPRPMGHFMGFLVCHTNRPRFLFPCDVLTRPSFAGNSGNKVCSFASSFCAR
jgi:hypothetical protein